MKHNGIELIHGDNMDLLRSTPNKFYDLAIVDPEYGIGISNNPIRQKHTKKNWDNSIPEKEYFNELFRVSKNQIIWGGNYFIDYLNNTQCFIIWDKKQPENFSLAMCEFAWCSIQSPAKIFRYSVLTEQGKIHPTQKPVALYSWLIKNYANQGDKILDTHLGSGSVAIAIDKANRMDGMNLTFTGIELDKEYFDSAVKRFNQYANQTTIFDL